MAADRSWTDAITNAALLGGFDMAQYLGWLARRSTRVEGALPQFLHEFTHHWCFDSIVGNAIAQLTLRARRNAHVHGLALRFDAIESDLLRAQAAELMLQPLAEGLALFAEFDITPGDSRVESRTTAACLICFGFPVERDADPLANATMVLRALLQTTRRRPDFLERKAGIYAQRFECEQGYLAGYLSVKALWAQLARQAPLLYDRDLFLGFLRSYVYDDARLVLTMLDPDLGDLQAAEAVAARVHERLGALVDCPDLVERVAAWEAACAQRLPVIGAIGVTEAERDRANEALMLLMDDVEEGGPISDLATHALMTLQERRYLTLGALPATATTRAGRTEVVVDAEVDGGAQPTRFVPAVPWAASAPLQGELVVVTPSRLPCVLVFFVAGQQARLVHSLGPLDGVDLVELARHVVNRQPSTAVHDALEAALAQALAHPVLALVLDHGRQNLLQAAENLYGALATLHADEDAVAGALVRLRGGGLLALLDDDADLVRGVASIGLANTMGTDSASLAFFASAAGLADDLVQRTIEGARVRHGMTLLEFGRAGGVIAVA